MHSQENLVSKSQGTFYDQDNDSEQLGGQTMSPPPFQLFASDAGDDLSGNPPDLNAEPVQMARGKKKAGKGKGKEEEEETPNKRKAQEIEGEEYEEHEVEYMDEHDDELGSDDDELHGSRSAPPANSLRRSSRRRLPLPGYFARQLEARLGDASRDLIRRGLEPHALGPYDMEGQQKATTTSFGSAFTTADQEHAEMRAVNGGIKSGDMQIVEGQIVGRDGHGVPANDFSTEEPHCGFCTTMLAMLGLPLTNPTAGRFGFESNLEYPIPLAIQTDLEIVRRFVGEEIDEVLESLKMDWEEFVESGYLQQLWTFIRRQILEVLIERRSEEEKPKKKRRNKKK